MASALLGVRPISKITSSSISKIEAPGSPILQSLSNTKIPSWLSPSPSSSSAQIIPSLISPLILPFEIFNEVPLNILSVVPIVATKTF